MVLTKEENKYRLLSILRKTKCYTLPINIGEGRDACWIEGEKPAPEVLFWIEIQKLYKERNRSLLNHCGFSNKFLELYNQIEQDIYDDKFSIN